MKATDDQILIVRKVKEVKDNSKEVLVVDDDRSILHTFTRVLQRAGFKIETAQNGKEALEKIKSKTFDVALIDVILGDSNGIDLLSKIDSARGKTVKIIMTGADSPENRTQALINGADAYLTKPINPETLLELLEEKLHCG